MFEHCLYFNTTSLARKLEREWTKAFKPFNLTPPQAFMLRIVLERKSVLHNALASELNISRSTATRTLDGLQKLGYIIKSHSTNDGREQIIEPTYDALMIKDAINEASGNVTKEIKLVIGNDTFEKTVGGIKNVISSI